MIWNKRDNPSDGSSTFTLHLEHRDIEVMRTAPAEIFAEFQKLTQSPKVAENLCGLAILAQQLEQKAAAAA